MYKIQSSLQQMCVLMEQSLETVCTSGTKLREGPMEFGTKTIKLESRELVNACDNVLKAAQNLLTDSAASTITHRVSHDGSSFIT